MKTLRFLLLLLPLVVIGQTSRDTVNGWYLWKSEGTGIDSAYSYTCDTSAYEGIKSQAFAYSTSGGATYSFRKDFASDIPTPDRISVRFRPIAMGPIVFSLGTMVKISVIVGDSIIASKFNGNIVDFETYSKGSLWNPEFGGWFDSLKLKFPTIRGIVLSFWLDANWENPSGHCTLLLDYMVGLYRKVGAVGFDYTTFDRFGDSGPTQYVTPKNCLFKTINLRGVTVDSFRVVNMSSELLTIGDKIVSTNSLFSIRKPLPWSVEPRDSVTIYVQFTPDGKLGQKSGLILINHSAGTDTVFVTANVVTGVVSDPNIVPIDFSLSQNYPNPFNPTTKIRFSIPKAGEVTLTIYDLLGREVRILVSGVQTAGTHEETFDASSLPSGTYLCRMQADGFTRIVKMVLMK